MIRTIFKRVAVCLALAAVMTAVGIRIAPAHADDISDFPDCYGVWATTQYAYGSGANAVYATGWHWYSESNGQSICFDINAQDNDAGDDYHTVRIVVCHSPSPCVAGGWGNLTPSVTWGVALNDWQFPCDASSPGCDFLWRGETRGDNGSLNWFW